MNLRGPLVDGEFGRLGRSSRWGLVVEMVQDASDDGGVDNEGEELHFSAAPGTPVALRVPSVPGGAPQRCQTRRRARHKI